MSLLRLGSTLIGAHHALPFNASAALMGRPILRCSSLLLRSFATDKEDKANESSPTDKDVGGEAKASPDDGGSTDASASPEASREDLIAQIKTKEENATKLSHQVETLTDSLKRTLADMENLRARTAREVDVSKKFAIQGFVKALMDVPDNLERAAGVVPADALKEDGNVPPEKLRSLLSGLLEGVRATENILLKVLKQHGVERYDPTGQAFDPNLHNALFEMPDPCKENNIIAVVTKKGYKLNDRVVRPAEVGVVKNPTS